MFALLQFAQLFEELFPYAIAAVRMVQASAPDAPGPTKKAAVINGVLAVVNAAPAEAAEFAKTRAAIAAQDVGAVALHVGHLTELSLSLCKSLGLFPKAAIVQGALPLDAAIKGVALNDTPAGG